MEQRKRIERLKSRQKDFTCAEAEALLREFSYVKAERKRMSGPRVMFTSERHAPIVLHRFPTRKGLPGYQMAYLLEQLEGEGLL